MEDSNLKQVILPVNPNLTPSDEIKLILDLSICELKVCIFKRLRGFLDSTNQGFFIEMCQSDNNMNDSYEQIIKDLNTNKNPNVKY